MASIIVQPKHIKLTDDQIAAEKRRLSDLRFVRLGLAQLSSGVELSAGVIREIKNKAAEVAVAMKGGSPER